MQEADKELLTRYFYGKCSPKEQKRAQELLLTPEAGDFFRQLSLKEWNEPVQEDDSARDLHEYWQKNINARIRFMERDTREKGSAVRGFPKFRYAAVWLGILFVSSLLVWKWQAKEPVIQVALIEKSNLEGIPVRYVLPDSSEVFLAAGSKMSYPDAFRGNTREISLQGEAFFQVTADPGKPFIIHTGEIHTQVLGTSFKVTAIEGRPLEVAVATGKVGVSRQEETLATLTPGHKATWYPQVQKTVTEQVNIEGLEQWKNGDLVFDRLGMEYIAGELQRRYGVTIRFVDNEVKANRVSGTYAAAKTIDQVMKTLAMAGKFRYETHDNKTFSIHSINGSGM